MKNLFVPYEIAKTAKEKGFNEPVLGFFNNDLSFPRLYHSVQEVRAMDYMEDNDIAYIGYEKDDTVFIEYKAMGDEVPAITHQQLLDWIRDKHKIHIYLFLNAGKDAYNVVMEYENFNIGGEPTPWKQSFEYHEALNKAFEEALKFIK